MTTLTESDMPTVSSRPPGDQLADPRAFESRAKQLADRLRPHDPQVVLVWETPASTVLGHVVARELGVTSLRCLDREGLATLTGALPPSGGIAVVGVELDSPEHLRAMIAVAQQHGLEVVVVGALDPLDDDAREELTPSGIAFESVSDD
jgi:adenine/guanine phosphoribosyltransferase-like PRPP-binding protein